MIRGNLATRPFYDERTIHRWLAVATLVVVAFTIYNAWQIVHYMRSDADLAAEAGADEARATELRTAAAALRQDEDEAQTRMTSAAALEANQLIARRTFSWTDLFNHFESALPPDVRITAIRPSPQAGARRAIVVAVVARSVEAIDAFMQNLEDTGAFSGALSRDERVTDFGEFEGAIEVSYTPPRIPEVAP